jgi:hypothetical protein
MIQSMRRGLLITAIAAASCAAVAAGAAGAGTVPDSTVTINSNSLHFYGKVRSSEPECKAGRKVRLYLESTGAGQFRGKTKSSASGSWTIDAEGTAGATLGRYYVQVKSDAERADGGFRSCRGTRSDTIPVTVP